MAVSSLCQSLQSLIRQSQACRQHIIRTLSCQKTSALGNSTLCVTAAVVSLSRHGLLLRPRGMHGVCHHPSSSKIHTSAVVCKFVPWKRTPEYTTKPMGLKESAGRNITGKITITGRGGGHKRRYRMVDFKRVGPEDGTTAEERVLSVRYDPCRTANIAMVAGGTHKRWILATVNMEAGDIVKTSGKIGRMTVAANEGDAHRLGALPIGCLVHNVELFEGTGGRCVRAAGTSAQLLRKTGGHVILQLPSKQQISVSEKCMATVGRVSNEEHNKRIIGKAGRNRWLGWRPSSGLWQRKGGWAGRKIHPPPPLKVYKSDDKNTLNIDV